VELLIEAHRVLEDSPQACVSRDAAAMASFNPAFQVRPPASGISIGAAKMGSLAPKLGFTRCTP